ncbi:methyl-accepting chemotaxis protein [Alkalihalobacterium chitinilyticum]|uniref:Methyl-accepting chemotaxis protein n=1 Tax=Alkalihalobacterium chitinilyticum TaxID=2980103 RepID=A0ABT5VH56_9BACI|nr:methyl-accepting chemotaxis protein [Alkalihalobacterium chitinilyticum]MDE5414776.1 methyl-accepting chemotaxis protein [Alkalihalobacterium chitinilyticum]
MRNFFGLGIHLMNKLSYIKKFSLILLLFLVPLLVVLFFLIDDANDRVSFAEKEREGIEYISELSQFVQLVQQHRGLSVTYLQGGTHVKEDIVQRQESITAIIQNIDQINERLGKGLLVEQQWDDIIQGWNQVSSNVYSYSAEEAISVHSKYIRELVDFQMYIATTSNLILDTDMANSFLVSSLLEDLPNMAEYMGMSRAVGTAIVNNKEMSDQERLDLLFNIKTMENYLNSTSRKLEFAFTASPEVETQLAAEYREAQLAAEKSIHLIEEQILNASSIRVDTSTFFSTITESLDNVYVLMNKGMVVIDNRLDQQISELKLRVATVIAISIFVTLLIIYFFVSFYFGVRNTITHIKEKMEQFANGDLTAITNLETKDESRQIGEAFNKMASEFQEIILSNKEISEQIAASSEELTASIDQTTEAVKQVATVIEEVANGAETQVSSATESALASEEMAEGIQKIAEASGTVSDLSTKTTEKAKAGSIAVNESVNQFNIIKDFVGNVSQVINDLSNHSKEIGNITNLINGVAEQTNLLALNAAIEAARAGEHGKGFAVVANEVRKLAEETKNSTSQISKIILQVQDLTSHAVEVMEEGTSQVEAGTRVIESLGLDFSEIMSSIDEVSNQIHDVSAVSQQLSANSEEVAATMSELSKIAQESSMNTQNVAASTEEQLATMEEINASATELSQVAQQLNDMINRFRL